MQQKTSQRLNVLLLGTPESGKTSIAKRLTHQSFDIAYKPTVGVNICFARSIDAKGNPLKLTLWDAGGATDNRSITETYLHDKNLSAIGLVLDSSVPLNEETILDWLDFLQKKPPAVPVLVLLNKIDLVNEKNRNQQKALGIQKVQTLLAQKTLANCTVILRFCSAKTGEGIKAAIEEIFTGQMEKEKSEQIMQPVRVAPLPVSLPSSKAAKPPDVVSQDKSTQVTHKRSRHRVKKEKNTSKPPPMVVAPLPVSLLSTHESQSPLAIESPQPVSISLVQTSASTLPISKQLADFNWRKAALKWLKNKGWVIGNVLIFTLSIALFVVVLLPVAGGLSTVGILPVVCLLVGGLVFVGWNIGCALYYQPKQLSQTAQDEAQINNVSENKDNFPHKKNGSNLFYPSSTPSAPIKPTSSLSVTCQNPSNQNS